MDLQSGSLLWPKQLQYTRPECLPLEDDLQCEVAVIGAGLTGALVGFSLVHAGLDVVLLDKRNVGEGSTSASTALVLYEIDVPLFKLIHMRGRRAAVRSYALCLNAIGQIARTVQELNDDCGFQSKRSLYCAQRKAHTVDLQKELRARRAAGFSVEYLTAPELAKHFKLAAPAALLSADAAQIDPLRFTHRLVASSQRRGLRVFGGTDVKHWEETRHGVVLRTAQGNRVKAKKLVVAAGYESQPHVPRSLVKLRSTYALATAPLKNIDQGYGQCVVWETGQPYCYLRTTRDQRILIGGEDEDFANTEARDRLIRRKGQALQRKISKWFPELSVKAGYVWAGTFGETKDSLPIIGSLHRSSHVLFALCYGANGTNFGVIAANLVTDHILGRRNPDANLFALDR